MTLLNPLYLAGLAAVALPILIHILQRDRVRKIVFPATRFLLGASKKITRTQQLREMLLMLLRAGVMALLAVALCRPFFLKNANGASGMTEGSKAAVILMDVSGSMRIGTRMDEGKKQALDLLATYRPQLDRVALVTFDHEANLAVPMTPELSQVSSAIAALKPGYGGTNLAAAMQRADQMLQADDVKNAIREIAVFSDLQRNGWAAYHGDWKLTPGVTLLPPRLLSLKTPENVAITQVAFPKSTVVSSRNEPISVQLVNYGTQDRPGLKVAINIDGKSVDEKEVNLGPSKTEIVRFNFKFDKPGDCAGTISVDAKDDFAEDNVYYFNVRVLPQALVLLVNGSPNTIAAQDDGRFVNEALSVAGSPFRVREVAAAKAGPRELDGAQAVVFTNVNSISSSMAAALHAFTENGGGVLIFPGDKVKAEEFNRCFSGIAPCRLKSVVAQSDKGEGWTIGEIDYQHPVFTRFSTPQSGDFSAAKFTKYYAVTDSQASRVLARFIDGRPALLEASLGKGYTMLFTSTAGMKWNDLCLQGGIFVPFIHEALKYLSVHSEGITTVQLGDALQFNSPNVEVTSPDGIKISVQQGANTVTIAKVPGIYTVKDGDKDQRLAINMPREESDPATLDGDELANALMPKGEQKEIDGVKMWVQPTASMRERIESGQHIGWYVLIALAVLLIGEQVLANNTSRH